jgi:hypothetical protein
MEHFLIKKGAKLKKIVAIIFILVTIGGVYSQQLGTLTPLQRILNELPAIPIAGRNLKFEFGGSSWIAKVNGENALAGTVEIVDIKGGSILTLKQTHVWAGTAEMAVGGLTNTWVAIPGPEIFLDYNNASSYANLSVASEARITEAHAAKANTTALSSVTVAAPPLIPVANTGFVTPNISGYFVVVNGLQTGPYDESGLRILISQKQLTKDSLVWKEGMSNWIVAGAVEELTPLFSTPASPKNIDNAQDSGFSSGTELGIINFQLKPIIDYIYIMPMFAYKGILMNDSLEFEANLGVPFVFSPEIRLGMDLYLMLTYNKGPLSFILGNKLALPVIKSNYWNNYSPMDEMFYREARGGFFPILKYNFSFDTGTLYLQASLPFEIIPDAFEHIGMHFGLGWKGENGISLGIREANYPKPEAKFFQMLALFVSYDTLHFMGELSVEIPTYEDGIRNAGIKVTPEVEFRFANGYKAYASLPIKNLFSDRNEVNNGLSIGIKKSF